MAVYDNLAYREELRHEIMNGEVLSMPPAAPLHNHIAGNIFLIFGSYLKGKKCVPFSDGTAVYFDEENRVIPDVMIVCDRSKIQSRYVYGPPDLLVEVLSPSTAKNDRQYKKSIYESNGVPEYWIVSPREKSIEVYFLRDGHYILDNLYTYCSEEDQEDMTEAEKEALTTEFRCRLFDGLVIRLDDIFGGLFE